MSTTRVIDLVSHSQSYSTVTLTRQQSLGLLARNREEEGGVERQQVIMETKREKHRGGE